MSCSKIFIILIYFLLPNRSFRQMHTLLFIKIHQTIRFFFYFMRWALFVANQRNESMFKAAQKINCKFNDNFTVFDEIKISKNWHRLQSLLKTFFFGFEIVLFSLPYVATFFSLEYVFVCIVYSILQFSACKTKNIIW